MSINTQLFEDVYGENSVANNEDVKMLEAYFSTRRESTAQVTLMPNFGLDEDMTYLIKKIVKMEGLRVYRGLLVELMPNYTLGVSDLMWLYPQLCKLRGYIELKDDIDIQGVKQKIDQIQELEFNDLVENKSPDAVVIGPLYNSIGLYEANSQDEAWGTSKKTNVLGYDLSADSYTLHFLISLLQQNLTIGELHRRLLTTKLGASNMTILNLANDAAKGMVEFITGRDEDDCGKWITDVGTNWLYKNASNYFYFNSCINLLSLKKRPAVLQTAQVAGVQLYKLALTNDHQFNYALPIDTGFLQGYHSDEDLNPQQRARIQDTFLWNKDVIDFNTSLMKKVNKINTSEWKVIEQKLQVIPDSFFRVTFCRLSSHNVYGRLDAKTLLMLTPGDKHAEVNFPLDLEHEVLKTIVEDYDRVQKFATILNPSFYSEGKLRLTKSLAKIILKI